MGTKKRRKKCVSCAELFTPRSKTQRACSRSCAARNRMGGWSRKPSARLGRRVDLDNRYFRSAWEANYARFLNNEVKERRVVKWAYEPRRFDFPIKRGNNSYMPDFQVWLPDGTYQWHEVKGWMDNNSKVKLKRFAKFFPQEELVLIDRVRYMEIVSEHADLPNWE